MYLYGSVHRGRGTWGVAELSLWPWCGMGISVACTCCSACPSSMSIRLGPRGCCRNAKKLSAANTSATMRSNHQTRAMGCLVVPNLNLATYHQRCWVIAARLMHFCRPQNAPHPWVWMGTIVLPSFSTTIVTHYAIDSGARWRAVAGTEHVQIL